MAVLGRGFKAYQTIDNNIQCPTVYIDCVGPTQSIRQLEGKIMTMKPIVVLLQLACTNIITGKLLVT